MDCNNPYVCLNYHCGVKVTKVKHRMDNGKKVVDEIKTVTIHRKSILSKV